EYAELTAVSKPDAYSIAYLEVLTRANPEEAELRLVYARQLGMLGRYDQAITALTPALAKRRRPDLLNLQMDLFLARARSIPEGNPRRRSELAEVHRQLGELATLDQS